jgi:predicted phage terminase large subunit-like protein
VQDGGALFKRHDFRYFTEDPEADLYVMRGAQGEEDKPVGRSYLYRFVTCDPAFSEKQTADYTAIGLWGVTPWMDLLLLEVARIRFDVENLPAAIRRYWEMWHPSDIRIESKAFGTRVIQALVAQGLPVIPVEADTDKVTRALSAVPRYEAHAVFHRQGGEYVYDYEREILHFPSGAHDDQVDMFSYAALALPELQVLNYRQADAGRTETGGLVTQQL